MLSSSVSDFKLKFSISLSLLHLKVYPGLSVHLMTSITTDLVLEPPAIPYSSNLLFKSMHEALKFEARISIV